LTEQLKQSSRAGGVRGGIRPAQHPELAGFLGINTNTVARVFEDLKQSGYVELGGEGRVRGPGAARSPSPHLLRASYKIR